MNKDNKTWVITRFDGDKTWYRGLGVWSKDINEVMYFTREDALLSRDDLIRSAKLKKDKTPEFNLLDMSS